MTSMLFARGTSSQIQAVFSPYLFADSGGFLCFLEFIGVVLGVFQAKVSADAHQEFQTCRLDAITL